MRKIFFLIALAMPLAFTSCSEDECDHDESSTGGQTPETEELTIVGRWYEEDYNEEVRYNANGTYYDKYCSLITSNETEGRYEFDQANNKLTYRYEFYGNNISQDFTVKNLTELGMVLSSNTVGDLTVERIVENYNLEVGESVQIQFTSQYPSYAVQSYTSKNSRLASVTSSGTITAEGEKGTTYIKIATDKGNAWVSVTVGDDCLDLWYDYESVMDADYSTMRSILGVPSYTGEDGYSFAYGLPNHNTATELDVFMDSSTEKVVQMALIFKNGTTSAVSSYLNSHYYPSEILGENYYTTAPDIDGSVAVLSYNKDEDNIFFYKSSYFTLLDYNYTFGYTNAQLVDAIGESDYTSMPWYSLYNSLFVYAVYFYFDSVTDKITAYQLYVSNEFVSSESIRAMLLEKYNFYKSNDAGTVFGYIDGTTMENSKIGAEYDTKEGVITFYDFENFGASSNAAAKVAMQSGKGNMLKTNHTQEAKTMLNKWKQQMSRFVK